MVGWLGGVCKVIFMSNPTTVEDYLSLRWGFDNNNLNFCREEGYKFKGGLFPASACIKISGHFSTIRVRCVICQGGVALIVA